MEKTKLNVLVLDDDDGDIEIFSRYLSTIHDWDIELVSFSDWPSAEAALSIPGLHVLFVDHFMGAINGLDVIKQIRLAGDRSPLILLTGAGHESLAIEAIRAGADDYLNKNGLNADALRRSLTIAIWQARLREEKAKIESDLFNSREEYRAIAEELSKANRKLNQLSTEDFLTGLANRRHFDATLAIELRRAERKEETVSLLFCDVDFFKQFNDTYGHPAGDHCLQKIAAVLKKVFKRVGDLPARFGGEEFTVILPNTSRDEAFSLAENFRVAVGDLGIPHTRPDAVPHVTISIGLFSSVVKKGVDSQWMISRADLGLLESKKQGRNRTTIVDV